MVGPIVLLTDRPAAEALTSLSSLGLDVKVERLSSEVLDHLAELAASVLVVDAESSPEAAFELLKTIRASGEPAGTLTVLGSDSIDSFPWYEVTDGFIDPAAPPAELGLRLRLAARKDDGGGPSLIRLGALSVNTETYHVSVAGRVLDLTYKEFELLRFLVRHPGRVFTRGDLLKAVWGFDFYGGTRTVDVHVRRLRAKLGAEHEGLIQTVRGVGYRSSAAGA